MTQPPPKLPDRACKNWLTTFLDWTMPVSEAPESLLIWSGLFCLSTILKRRVRFSKRYVKAWDVYPTNYVLFVAPPGVAKKSTTSGYTERLIIDYNKSISVTDPSYVNLGPTSGSDVAMIKAMSETLDGSMSVIAGEFGNIVKTRTMETYDFFTKMFDNDPHYIHETVAGGRDAILDPSFNLLGCTTPDWISNNSGYIVGGGFAARTVFVFEYKARQRKLFDVKVVEEDGKLVEREIGPDVKTRDKMRANLLNDLKIIGKLKGEAKPESLALTKRLNEWYEEYVDAPAIKGTETFQQRKHVHTLRTAMLLSVCERNDLIITENHVDAALELITYVEKRLARGFLSVGRNPFSAGLYNVLDYIEAHGPIRSGLVSAYFFNDIPPNDMAQIIEVLRKSGQIEEVNTGNGILLRKAK